MQSPILCVVLLAGLHTAFSNPVVKTKYGTIEGRTLNVKSVGKSVSRFLGVPFAKAPVGNLRWKPTEEPDPWDGVLKTNSLSAACPQGAVGVIWLTHPGWSKYDEDCLYMNIFTPSDLSKGPYPVMVWLHGGGYVSSANVQYPGHFLAAKDVVVVVPNYRIGIFGFMSTGDDAARGNYGLLDQIRAFEFVRDNIAAFGGDPNKVTTFGQSAGAASSGLLSLSPRARGLFHQVITESGSDQAIWAINPPGSKPEDYTKQVAKKLNCSRESSKDMVECMRALDYKTVFDNSGFSCTPGFFCQGFAPVVDGEGGVLPQDPWTMREKNLHAKLPLMSGQCTDDGSMYTALMIPESLKGGFNRTEFEYHLHNDLLNMFSPLFPDKEQDVFEALNWYYSPWPYLDDEDKNRLSFNVLITDFGFGVTGDIQMKSQSKTNDVYFYLLGYRSKKAAPLIPEWLGVPHNGELPYVLGWPMLQDNFNLRLDSGMLVDLIPWDEEDQEWAEYFMTMWTNFAKYGNPTPEPVTSPGNNTATSWMKFTADKMNYMSFNRDIEYKLNYRQRNFAMWTDYLPYVAGLDFIRPRQGPLTKTQQRSFGDSVNTKDLEERMSMIYQQLTRRAFTQ